MIIIYYYIIIQKTTTEKGKKRRKQHLSQLLSSMGGKVWHSTHFNHLLCRNKSIVITIWTY